MLEKLKNYEIKIKEFLYKRKHSFTESREESLWEKAWDLYKEAYTLIVEKLGISFTEGEFHEVDQTPTLGQIIASQKEKNSHNLQEPVSNSEKNDHPSFKESVFNSEEYVHSPFQESEIINTPMGSPKAYFY